MMTGARGGEGARRSNSRSRGLEYGKTAQHIACTARTKRKGETTYLTQIFHDRGIKDFYRVIFLFLSHLVASINRFSTLS